jgi:hypothetical protein
MSKLNCKPGDLAIIVRSTLGNENKIVRVLYADPGNSLPSGSVYEIDGRKWFGISTEFRWVIESQGSDLRSDTGALFKRRPVRDCWLRPIRDPGDDAKDETLSWLPVPTKNTETV